MPKFEFEIIEKLKTTVEIEADNEDQAYDILDRDYSDGKIRLGYDDYYDHEFKLK